LGESPSLSDSPHPIVDAADLFPSYNCRVQIGIWLINWDSHNWFYLLLQTIWTTRGLNRMRLPIRGSGGGHMSLIYLVLDGQVAWSRRGQKLTTTKTLPNSFLCTF